MSKKLYLNLFLSLLILLIGSYFASELNNNWTIRIANIFTIVLAGLFLIGFNPKNLPKKENSNFKLIFLIPVTAGVIGLFLVNYFTQILAYNLLEWEWPVEVLRNKSELIDFLGLIVVFGILEEFYFRRIVSQKIFNSKGFSKAVWVSAIIFSLSHLFSDTGLLATFTGGIALGFIYLRTKNLWISIITHLLYNLLYLFGSPKIDANISVFNNKPRIIIFICFGILLVYTMFLLLKKLTEIKPAGNNGYNSLWHLNKKE